MLQTMLAVGSEKPRRAFSDLLVLRGDRRENVVRRDLQFRCQEDALGRHRDTGEMAPAVAERLSNERQLSFTDALGQSTPCSCSRRIAGTRGPMSFATSTCHHGLKTAPRGEDFNRLKSLSMDCSMPIIFSYP